MQYTAGSCSTVDVISAHCASYLHHKNEKSTNTKNKIISLIEYTYIYLYVKLKKYCLFNFIFYFYE